MHAMSHHSLLGEFPLPPFLIHLVQVGLTLANSRDGDIFQIKLMTISFILGHSDWFRVGHRV